MQQHIRSEQPGRIRLRSQCTQRSLHIVSEVECNSYAWQQRIARVRHAPPRPYPTISSSSSNSSTLTSLPVPPSLPCSEDTLRLHFSQYGAVEATDIMKDRLSGKSRGFGFVTFVDPACAAAALQVEHTIDGRRCEAKVALPKVTDY